MGSEDGDEENYPDGKNVCMKHLLCHLTIIGRRGGAAGA